MAGSTTTSSIVRHNGGKSRDKARARKTTAATERRRRTAPATSTVPPIETILRELAKGIPASEWAKLPRDLGKNHDHYIYGTPKK